jgi:DNA-binding XRE family transcriptional regulator
MDDPRQKSAADKKAARSSVIEEQIKLQQKRKEERAFLEELAKRIHIAREGKHHSEKGEFSEAITAYRRFFAITAKSVSVDIEQLKPTLFDERTRKGESLLISSMLFDMLKILDKLDNPSAKEERRLYHKLFIRFTLGQPFQIFAAENLRKYLVYRKSVRNKAEFWATYEAIRSKKFCIVASWAFGSEEHETVRRLRRFRNLRLTASPAGRAFISFYYRNGGSLARALALVPGARPLVRGALRLLTGRSNE